MAKLSPQFLDEIRDRLPVSQVVSRKVALKRMGREYRGLSPFKIEKTPSFYVNDQKSAWFDFSSGENGDIFKFVMMTEGVEFIEAVKSLAEMAGVRMPEMERQGPAQVEIAATEDRLREIVKVTCAFFAEQLRSQSGTQAREYLEHRGVTTEMIEAFNIGYAPPGRMALRSYLLTRGHALPDLVLSGVLIGGEDIPEPYDRFRNRVMFPILDQKSRPVAFGGRAIAKDQEPKYLNSNETPVFKKGYTLYNFSKAREIAHKAKRLIVVEGYMDVVGMTGGGIGECVASLGTALTESHLRLLWRVTPEPILCFDGDAAGQRAAYRALETALPHLEADQTLNFAFMPDGKDPDDLMREGGRDAVEDVLRKPLPLIDVMWTHALQQKKGDSPEERARLENGLYSLVSTIEDANTQRHYRAIIKERLYQAFSTARKMPQLSSDWRKRQAQMTPLQRLAAAQAVPSGASADLVASVGLPRREAFLLGSLIVHSELALDQAEEVSQMRLRSPVLARMRDFISEAASLEIPVREHLRTKGMGHVMDQVVGVFDRVGISAEAVADRWREAYEMQAHA